MLFYLTVGKDRVFNTPTTEQGIVGFGIGMAACSQCYSDSRDSVCRLHLPCLWSSKLNYINIFSWVF